MPYMLQRNDGTLVKKIPLKVPRLDEVVTAEVRLHGVGADAFPAVWYRTHGEWRIFLAGETAKRFIQ